MVGWHHRLNGHEFEQTLGDGEGQGSLACCSPLGHPDFTQTHVRRVSDAIQPSHTLSSPSPPAPNPPSTGVVHELGDGHPLGGLGLQQVPDENLFLSDAGTNSKQHKMITNVLEHRSYIYVSDILYKAKSKVSYKLDRKSVV